MGYSPLRGRAGIQIPRQLLEKNACRRLALQVEKCVCIALLYYVLVVISMKLHFSTSGLALIWPSNVLFAAMPVMDQKRRWWLSLTASSRTYSGNEPHNSQASGGSRIK